MSTIKITQLKKVNVNGSLGSNQYPVTVASVVSLSSGDTVDNVLTELSCEENQKDELKTENWTLIEENGELVFKYGAATTMKLNNNDGFVSSVAT